MFQCFFGCTMKTMQLVSYPFRLLVHILIIIDNSSTSPKLRLLVFDSRMLKFLS